MNIFDYIKKNKDKSFKELPFNECDALIFSLISYVEFKEDNLNIKDASKKIKNVIKARFDKENIELVKILSDTIRYQDLTISNTKRKITKTTQFGATTIRIPHILTFISFEGTGDLLVGWEEDMRLSYEYPIEAQKLASEYINNALKLSDLKVYIGGHSKGGNLAMAAYLNASLRVRLRIKEVYNFDGPGFLPRVIDSKKYQKLSKKIISYFPEESLVGMCLENKCPQKIVKSHKHKVDQHDAYNWYIDNNKFVLTKLSDYSKMMHKKTINIINTYTPEQLKLFTETFFNLLYNSGYTKKSELRKIDLNKFRSIIKGATNLTEEERKIIFDLFKALIIKEKD